MLPNSRLNHLNYRIDFGVIITLMLKENAGEKKTLLEQANF
jgi:predicted ATPase